jgi:hypothetical protein
MLKLFSQATLSNLLFQYPSVSRITPLIESIIEPNPETPEEEFEVEYVYGYRTFDCR